MSNVRTQVKDFIMKEFLPGEDPNELTDTTPLISGQILDSLATLKLVTFLEEQYGIQVEAYEADVDNLDSIEKINSFVEGKLRPS